MFLGVFEKFHKVSVLVKLKAGSLLIVNLSDKVKYVQSFTSIQICETYWVPMISNVETLTSTYPNNHI